MDSRWKQVSSAIDTMSMLAAWGVPSPDAAAIAVQHEARCVYLGIQPEVVAFQRAEHAKLQSAEFHPNLPPWPTYQLVDQLVAKEEAGTVYFLRLQVSDGTIRALDRNEARLANSLGPPVGHPSLRQNATADWEDGRGDEFILVRVMRTEDGKYMIEGMVKGSDQATQVHAIAKGFYVGVSLSGAGRDHGIAEYKRLPPSPTKPAMSNKEIEDAKTIKAHKADPHAVPGPLRH